MKSRLVGIDCTGIVSNRDRECDSLAINHFIWVKYFNFWLHFSNKINAILEVLLNNSTESHKIEHKIV